MRRSPPAFNPEILHMREKIQQLEARLTEQQLAKPEVEEKGIKLKVQGIQISVPDLKINYLSEEIEIFHAVYFIKMIMWRSFLLKKP